MEHLEHNEKQENAGSSQKWAGLGVRVISGLTLAAVFLGLLWVGGFLFSIIILLAAMQMLREWDSLTENEDSMWGLLGLFYVAVPCASLLWLRGIPINYVPNAGLFCVLYVLFVVWATDIGAYFTGRIVGGAKLAPSISPGKTWAGLGGGMTAAGITGGLCFIFCPFPATLLGAILLGIVLAAVAQAGDLYESWLKRRAGVKDSSSLIPGHGGLLDRVDGLMFTLPLFTIMVYLSGTVK